MKRLLIGLTLSLMNLNAMAQMGCFELASALNNPKALDAYIASKNSSKLYEKISEALTDRVKTFEITDAEANELLSATKNFKETSGEDLVGAGILTCYENFSELAFKNVNSLIRAAASSTSTDGAYELLVSKSKTLFGDTDAIAKKRICELSSTNANCQIFSNSIVKKVNCN